MDKKARKELLAMYKKWVINNPNLVTEVETVATWSSYFIAGKINKSPIVSELVYTISKLVTLFNDRLIKEAYGEDPPYYSLREQIKLSLTVIHYTEVFIELVARSRWGTRGKWTAATLLQMFKCCSSLILLYRFKEVLISHPPIPSLQRKKYTEGKIIEDENSNMFFTLKRSGRVLRRVDGAPGIEFRDWESVRVNVNHDYVTIDTKDVVLAESLHILKPLLHLAAMRVFGTKSWKQWLVALSVDIICLNIYSKHMKKMSYEQSIELGRRKLGLILYMLRSPMYKGYSKNVIENVLKSLLTKIPLTSFLCDPVIHYLNHWQDIYFYMWSS